MKGRIVKNLVILIAVAVLSISFSCVAKAAEVKTVYVSKNGSDLGDGSFFKPYATLQKAIEATRSFSGERYIFIRGGEYKIKSQINLTSSDKNLLICAYGDETVTFSGSSEIPYSSFARVTDKDILDRIIENSGKNNVMQVHLPDVGITSYGQITTNNAPSLICNKKLMRLAEYPNKGTSDNGGYLYTAEISGGNSFTCGTRVNKYTKASDIWILGFFQHDWDETISPATLSGNRVTISNGSKYGMSNNRRVRFFNMLEELDVPGEYYIDRNSGNLYIIPPEDFKSGDYLEFSTQNNRFINCYQSQNVTIKNIVFEGTLATAVNISSANNVVINGCEFYATGDPAVNISSSVNCGVINSSIHDVPARGVYINGGNRKNLTSSGCYVENCYFERFSQYRITYRPAIDIAGCGFLIKNNYFRDSPHFAISYSTNNATIEYNEFDKICNETSDAGAIYTGRDWSTQGNIIRYNYFHDMPKIYSTAGYEIQAVYLDDCHSATSVYKNIFYKCHSPGLFGGGRYNTFKNNMIFECTKPFVMDARGETWTTSWLNENSGDSIYKKLKAFDYKNGIWAESYPYLVNILEDEPKVPKHNTIKNNIEYKSGGFNIHEDVYKYGDVKRNISISSTAFLKDYAGGDFEITDLDMIRKSVPEFEDIPFNKMGNYATEKQEAPKTTIVPLEPTANVGDSITLSYNSNAAFGKIADRIVMWYERVGGVWVEIPNHNKDTLVLDESYAGKTVSASVTAVDSRGNISSTWFGSMKISEIDYSKGISVTKEGNTLKFNNTLGVNVGLTVFGPKFNAINGYKNLTALEFLSVSVGDSDDADFDSDTVIITSSKTLEPILVK